VVAMAALDGVGLPGGGQPPPCSCRFCGLRKYEGPPVRIFLTSRARNSIKSSAAAIAMVHEDMAPFLSALCVLSTARCKGGAQVFEHLLRKAAVLTIDCLNSAQHRSTAWHISAKNRQTQS
jgi:hypothetical protein